MELFSPKLFWLLPVAAIWYEIHSDPQKSKEHTVREKML